MRIYRLPPQPTSSRTIAGVSMLILLAAVLCTVAVLLVVRSRLAAGQMERTAGGTGLISPFFTPEVQYWEADIARWASEHGLDPNMVATVMQIESCGNPVVASPAGAQGLFQVMPFHFEAGENALDPATNARRGLAFLADLLADTGGDTGRTFAGYNGGPGAAFSPWNNWAAETQRYFYWSTGIYADARAGAEQSERLQEWLDAGGLSLCRQAAAELGLRE